MPRTSQREMRQGVKLDDRIEDVTSVTSWYRADFFKSGEAARGAFELAYQQGLDGMGKGIALWMGLTEAEFDLWMQNGSLPPKR